MERKLSSEEFEHAVKKDPAWAASLTEPVTITGTCHLGSSKISHLSPFLHFKEDVWLENCKDLKVAEGKFDGWVDFSNSGIEEVGDLKLAEIIPIPCDLGGTPLCKKDLLKAAEIMTGSTKLKTWEDMLGRTNDWWGWAAARTSIQEAIALTKKQRIMQTLQKQTPLEI
jgi:hypothetical protein